MVTIAVDAMGGDHAPRAEIEGALQAVRSLGVQVILVGREERLKKELADRGADASLPIQVVHASEVVTMDDSAARAVRSKRDSSIRVAARLVRDGVAQGLVSAGNTGAVMATAKMVQGTIPGVDRPALALPFPTLKGGPAVMLDVGANVDCTPRMLAQFAVMGDLYARIILHASEPRVGLLSIGEEDHKGNVVTREAMPLLKALPINFVGNVEGSDLFTAKVDVIVCDGFVGNVALKVSEGMVEVIKQLLRDSLSATVTRKIGYMLSRPAYVDFKKRVDYSEYGGALLLGVRGVSVICHGRSNPNAIKNAIRVAKEFADARINQRIETELRRSSSSLKEAASAE